MSCFANFTVRSLLPLTLTLSAATLSAATALFSQPDPTLAQLPRSTPGSQPLTLRANTTEANAKTGVVVAKGNVQINYPSRQIQATSAQAIYYSKERRIVLSGDVYVLQQGNSLRGESITYLVDEGRFVALPQNKKQVEAVYLINEPPATQTSPPTQSPFPRLN